MVTRGGFAEQALARYRSGECETLGGSEGRGGEGQEIQFVCGDILVEAGADRNVLPRMLSLSLTGGLVRRGRVCGPPSEP